MDSLKLGLVGLPDAEAALVATLFRLHRVEPSFIWSLVDAGPFDAVLADAGVSDESLAAFAGRSARATRLMPVGQAAAGDNQMSRPIRSDHLVAWLNAIEVGILHGGDGFASTAGHSGHVPSLLGSWPGRVANPLASNDETANRRFKLRRWPAPAVLAADVVRIRAATLLSRRPMSLAELSTVSGMPLKRCEGFVGELAQVGLLEMTEDLPSMAPAPIKPQPADNEPAKTALTRAGFGRALISSIRRRFGMG